MRVSLFDVLAMRVVVGGVGVCLFPCLVGGRVGGMVHGHEIRKVGFFFLMKKLSESRKVTQKNASHGISLDKVQLLDCMPISKQTNNI